MHDSDSQFLSCLMDGEWQDLDPSQCAAEVCRVPELQAKWARYHLIRDVLHNEAVQPAADLAVRVRDALADEPVYSNVAAFDPTGSRIIVGSAPTPPAPDMGTEGEAGSASPAAGSRWRRTLSGLALVASVALLTVVGLNLWQGTPGSDADPALAVADSSTPAGSRRQSDAPPIDASPAVEFIANRNTHWVTTRPDRQAEIEARLNMFLSQHIENSPTADRQGMLPYSRLVGYDELVSER